MVDSKSFIEIWYHFSSFHLYFVGSFLKFYNLFNMCPRRIFHKSEVEITVI